MGSLEPDLSHLAQAVGPHIGHIDARRQRAQGVVGADVRGRLLSADVLLTGGKGEVEAAATLLVVGGSDQAAGKTPHELLAARDEADVRCAVARAQTELLTFTDGDVGSVLTRGREDGQAYRVDAGDGRGSGGVSALGGSASVDQESEKVRLLEDHGGCLRPGLGALAYLDPTPVAERAQHLHVLGMEVARHDDLVAAGVDAVSYTHLTLPT